MNATRLPTVAYLARKRNPSTGPLLPAFVYMVAPEGVGKTTIHTKLGDAIKRIKKDGMTPVTLPDEEGYDDDTTDLTQLEWDRVHKAFKTT